MSKRVHMSVEEGFDGLTYEVSVDEDGYESELYYFTSKDEAEKFKKTLEEAINREEQ